MLYTAETEAADRAVVEAVGRIAEARGSTRAQVALAWLRSKPVVTAPLVGASTPQQIDDAVTSLELALDAGEIRELEAPYTPRHDFQGVSDDRELAAIMAQLPQFAPADGAEGTS